MAGDSDSGRPTRVATERRKVSAQFAELQEAINPAQQ
jgi:hypothetical protein